MGRYFETIRIKDEQRLYEASIHWSIYIWPSFWTLVTLGLAIPFTVFWFIAAAIEQSTSEMVISNRRLVAKFGLIRRTSIEQRLSKIDSIVVRQGLLGRMLNYGKVYVYGSGASLSPFGPMGNPLAFKRAIETAIADGETAAIPQANEQAARL